MIICIENIDTQKIIIAYSPLEDEYQAGQEIASELFDIDLSPAHWDSDNVQFNFTYKHETYVINFQYCDELTILFDEEAHLKRLEEKHIKAKIFNNELQALASIVEERLSAEAIEAKMLRYGVAENICTTVMTELKHALSLLERN